MDLIVIVSILVVKFIMTIIDIHLVVHLINMI